MVDAYAILRVSRTADLAEIKAAYRKALLKYHPDKGGGQYSIDDVNAAYRQVANADAPSEMQAVVHFSEIVDLSDFTETETGWVRHCRCGADGYSLSEQDLEYNGDADEIAVQCSGCSIWVLVQYAVEE